MMKRLRHTAERAYAWITAPAQAGLLRWGERLLNAGLIGLLVYQIGGTPLPVLLNSLPRSVWFYLIYLYLFFLVPVSEYFIYRYKWSYSGRQALKGFLLKKIYNNEVYNYTGELFFITWISRYLNIPRTEAALFVKDNNVISSVVSGVLAFGVIGLQWALGYFDAEKLVAGSHTVVNLLVLIVFLLGTAALVKYRKKLVHSDRRLTLKLVWGYSFRYVWRHAVLVGLWYSAAPEVPLDVWMNFLFIRILLDRLPVGNRSLVFLTMAPWLSGSFDIGMETFTGIQVAVTVLDKAVSGLALLWARRQPEVQA